MFRRKDTNLPKEPRYSASLQELGYEINTEGQIVSISKPHSFFNRFYTDNERANEVRTEALHECARVAVLSSLETLGVYSVYLSGQDGATVTTKKPSGPHIPILASNLELLKDKREVIVVINAHTQDLGIWAWGILMYEGGIDPGSAVGLIKKLGVCGTSSNTGDRNEEKEQADGDASSPGRKDSTFPDARTAEQVQNPELDLTSPDVPGVIILNPGQLLYSPTLHKTMSHASWQARPRPDVLSSSIEIDDTTNRVPGHHTAAAHTGTVMGLVLPKLVNKDVKLFPVGICDGAETLVSWCDAELQRDPQHAIGRQLDYTLLISSTHSPSEIKSKGLKRHLAMYGRSYIVHPESKGKLIKAPQIPEIRVDHLPHGATVKKPVASIKVKVKGHRKAKLNTKDNATAASSEESEIEGMLQIPGATKRNVQQHIKEIPLSKGIWHHLRERNPSVETMVSGSTNSDLQLASISSARSSDELMFPMDMSPRVKNSEWASLDSVAKKKYPKERAPHTFMASEREQDTDKENTPKHEQAGEHEHAAEHKTAEHGSDVDVQKSPDRKDAPVFSLSFTSASSDTLNQLIDGVSNKDSIPSSPEREQSDTDRDSEEHVEADVKDGTTDAAVDIWGKDDEPYNYSKDPVSCPTYSAGPDILVPEYVWPSVMDDVLLAFRPEAETENETEQESGVW